MTVDFFYRLLGIPRRFRWGAVVVVEVVVVPEDGVHLVCFQD